MTDNTSLINDPRRHPAAAEGAATPSKAPADLAGKLEWLCQFGKPRLHRLDAWHACIEMNTNTTGSQFKVHSDFDHPAAEAAVDVLISRMLQALAAISGENRG